MKFILEVTASPVEPIASKRPQTVEFAITNLADGFVRMGRGDLGDILRRFKWEVAISQARHSKFGRKHLGKRWISRRRIRAEVERDAAIPRT